MSRIISDQEFEASLAGGVGYGGREFEDESEGEAEAFFGGLANLIRRGLQSPTLRKVAGSAARAALGALSDNIGGSDEFEAESEDEWELEGERVLSPIRRVYPDALMEHLGHTAAAADSEAEVGEAFAPLVSLAASKVLPAAAKLAARHGPALAKAAPRIAHQITRVSPHLTRSVQQIGRTLHRSPATRPLLRTVPHIVRQTTAQLARHAAHGRPVTPRAAVHLLARNANRVLANPRHAVRAYHHSRHLDRRYHGPHRHHHRHHHQGGREYGYRPYGPGYSVPAHGGWVPTAGPVLQWVCSRCRSMA